MTKQLKASKITKSFEAKLFSIKKLINYITVDDDSYSQTKIIIKAIHYICGSNFVLKPLANALIIRKYLDVTSAKTDCVVSMALIENKFPSEDVFLFGDISTESEYIP